MNTASSPTSNGRDLRLDFFRGLAMLIIYTAHIPRNHWWNFIPARFGLSDAAEMFVFLSGFAAAIAFGGTFRRHGMFVGTARIGYRCWQLYVAHLGLFFAIATLLVVANRILGTAQTNYINSLNLGFFFSETETALVGLLTLTYIPNYFDILPMYIGVLALTPVVVGLSRLDVRLSIVFCVSLYLLNWTLDWGLPADPRNDREWFFNPLAWQLIFFTGFALSAGWIRPPPLDWRLIIPCAIFVILCVPLGRWQIYTQYEWIKEFRDWLRPGMFGFSKTDFALLRYLHFLALAYLAVCFLKGREHWLGNRWLAPIVKTGQQALPVFLSSMLLSRVAGMVLDELDRNDNTWALVNIGGWLILMGLAYVYGWFKSNPWRRRPTIAEDPRDQLQVDPGRDGAWRPAELPSRAVET